MNEEMLRDCLKRISPFIHKTPVMSSHLINEMVNAEVIFKCENFQKMGAFKMRGATNAIMQLTDEQKANGVLTHSSGNFAQALSLAAKSLGVKAYIIMPENVPKVKADAVKEYGGAIVTCKSTIEAREQISLQIAKETGATFIHPSNDRNVIIGNSTACLELLDEHSGLDYVICPIGGGGLIAGTALATYFLSKNCKVIGAEPSAVDDAYRSLKSGKIETNNYNNTIADGLRTHLGDINFPIIQNYVNHIFCVEEHEIVNAMKIIFERMKIVVEPSSAVALAAVIREKEFFKRKKIGVILSGGNIDLSKMPF